MSAPWQGLPAPSPQHPFTLTWIVQRGRPPPGTSSSPHLQRTWAAARLLVNGDLGPHAAFVLSPAAYGTVAGKAVLVYTTALIALRVGCSARQPLWTLMPGGCRSLAPAR